MRKLALALALLLAAPAAHAQFFGDLECHVLSGRCVPTNTLKGEYVKSITPSGTDLIVIENDAFGIERIDTIPIGSTGVDAVVETGEVTGTVLTLRRSGGPRGRHDYGAAAGGRGNNRWRSVRRVVRGRHADA